MASKFSTTDLSMKVSGPTENQMAEAGSLTIKAHSTTELSKTACEKVKELTLAQTAVVILGSGETTTEMASAL